MTEPLDRPVWSALTGRQAHLAVARGAAVRIDPAYGLFAAARDHGEVAQAALAGAVRLHPDPVGVAEAGEWPAPLGTQAEPAGQLLQMVYDGPIPTDDDPRAERLGETDAEEMAALALATEPGPWRAQTHRYGDYYGVRIGGRLAAMAGERLLPAPGWAEVSGVCTWPEFRGNGLARLLMERVMRGLAARGDQPFLHVWANNTGAIALYERMGFRRRTTLTLTRLVAA